MLIVCGQIYSVAVATDMGLGASGRLSVGTFTDCCRL
jgi:hypothetical protein